MEHNYGRKSELEMNYIFNKYLNDIFFGVTLDV